MKSPQFVALGLAGLLLSSTAAAMAQDSQTDADRLRHLEDEVQALLKQQDSLKTQQADNEQRIRDLMNQLAAVNKTPPIKPAPAASAAPIFKGDVTYRVDDTNFKDQFTGVIPPGDRGTVRERFRLYATVPLMNHSEAGMAFTTGESNPGSPTVPYIAAGDGLRAKSFSFLRAYFAYHFGNRPDSAIKNDANNDAAIYFGKFANPFWRGEAGTFASEMVWDNDVAPEGIALRVPVTKRGAKVGVANTLAYLTVFQRSNLIFSGITTDVWGLVDQTKVDAGWLKGAAQYLHYQNLNSGLHVPSFTTGLGGSPIDTTSDSFIDPNAASNAWLLQSALGLQSTNSHNSYGAGASGFVTNHFDILNLTGQVLPKIGNRTLQPWATVDWAHNFAVNLNRNGYGLTVGLSSDPRGPSYVTNPGAGAQGAWSTYFTYRDVDADATLATFADSDIGGGTDYRGGEFGINYRIRQDLQGQILAIQYKGYPRKSDEVRRIFFDVVKSF